MSKIIKKSKFSADYRAIPELKKMYRMIKY